MTAVIANDKSLFKGLYGRGLRLLLQFKFVRFHRIQKGFSETPIIYQDFLHQVVWPRIANTTGRVGIFGAGSHTDIALKSMPKFAEKVFCLTDNNKDLWYQTKFNKPILPPTEAVKACDIFFLSTAIYQDIFRADLKRLHFKGEIISIEDEVPPTWFL